MGWDSCTWIALIWDETVRLDSGAIEDRGALCRAVIDDAEKGGQEICTCALSLAEVSKHPAADGAEGGDKLKSFFENDYIIPTP